MLLPLLNYEVPVTVLSNLITNSIHRHPNAKAYRYFDTTNFSHQGNIAVRVRLNVC